jgi:riboflavin kinase/FMN adenylyltransferase
MAVYFNIEGLPRFHKAVITIGTFDGVHQGHKAILNEVVKHAAEVGGESVLLTFEPHPRKILFPNQPLKLLTPLNQKLQLLTEAGIKHIVVVPFTEAFSNLSAEEYIRDFLVKLFHPESIVIGYDHHFGHDRTGNIQLLQQYAPELGYKVDEIPAQLIDEATVSSTKIREALTQGQVTEAAHMLGRDYNLAGTVLYGAQLGRTIGYPTANIKPENDEQLIPARGVYAVRIKWREQLYGAMLNIGFKPTVSNEMQLHIEAHIFNFNHNLYNERLEVIFVSRLRDEQKFPSLDALKDQLGKDRDAAMQVLNP